VRPSRARGNGDGREDGRRSIDLGGGLKCGSGGRLPYRTECVSGDGGERVPEGVQHVERGLSALALVPEGLQHRVGVERGQRGIGGLYDDAEPSHLLCTLLSVHAPCSHRLYTP